MVPGVTKEGQQEGEAAGEENRQAEHLQSGPEWGQGKIEKRPALLGLGDT